MESTHQDLYNVKCTIGANEITAHAVVDRQNSSIHLHVFGEMVVKKRTPIQVKHSDKSLSEGKDADLITQILTDHFADQQVQINRISKVNGKQGLTAPAGHPLRIIVRFRGRPSGAFELR